MKPGGNLVRQAISEAYNNRLPGKDGRPYDACRHLLWSAEMTRCYGEDLARLIVEAHELDARIREGQFWSFDLHKFLTLETYCD